ncbi:uncharacterized protein LOC141913309 [Tubulanus polymorphus]|uniref:uncharacterized protein LOC141913309 n=1 Tax=Tubulanus polymorphus TaxID=672921 RepID=UPI003DA66840
MKLLIVFAAVLALTAAELSYEDHVENIIETFSRSFESRSKRGLFDSELLDSLVTSIRGTLADVKTQVEAGLGKSKTYLEAKYEELKNYVDSLELNDKYHEVVAKAKTVMDQLQDKIANAIAKRHLEIAFQDLEHKVYTRALADLQTRATFKETMKEAWTKVKSGFSDFGDWLKDRVKENWDNVKPQIEQIKDMATKVLNNAVNDINEKVMTQATQLFNKYKDELGPMIWAKIEQKFKDVTGKDAKKEIVDKADQKPAVQE